MTIEGRYVLGRLEVRYDNKLFSFVSFFKRGVSRLDVITSGAEDSPLICFRLFLLIFLLDDLFINICVINEVNPIPEGHS